jgi:hypothetical protein
MRRFQLRHAFSEFLFIESLVRGNSIFLKREFTRISLYMSIMGTSNPPFISNADHSLWFTLKYDILHLVDSSSITLRIRHYNILKDGQFCVLSHVSGLIDL